MHDEGMSALEWADAAEPRAAVPRGHAPARERGLHVAIIMDGSGRWAQAHGLPRVEGHRAGAAAVRRIVEAAPALGIRTLTLFAFSSDNWKRPPGEVGPLMALMRDFLLDFRETAAARGVRVDVIGRRDRLSRDLLAAVEAAASTTARGRDLHLRLAIDYSARDAIVRAACRLAARTAPGLEDLLARHAPPAEYFQRALSEALHASLPAPDVDLLIRTGGEQRLSDFLLWECAYAELYFTRRMWPEFGPSDLEAAMRDFGARERRFGRLPAERRGARGA
jgi:undecaprenyl diphosphate synthase